MPHNFSVMSPITYQVFSYLAHGKQPPANITDPVCQPSRDSSHCSCVGDFMTRGEREGACVTAFQTLERVRFEKGWCAKQRHRCFGITLPIAEMKFRSRCRSGTYYGTSSGDFYGTALSFAVDEDADTVTRHKQMTLEFALKERLNEIGEAYNRSIDDTGVYTVLKFLNDLEAEALDAIVERDAPELADQVSRFNANTIFTYKTIGVDLNHPPYYLPSRKPRDLTSSDFSAYRLVNFYDVQHHRMDLVTIGSLGSTARNTDPL